jgi:hypothetical protein
MLGVDSMSVNAHAGAVGALYLSYKVLGSVPHQSFLMS